MPGHAWLDGLGIQADILEELAVKAGIDPSGLRATVAAFNAHTVNGRDPVFGRGESKWRAWMCGDPFNESHPNIGTLDKGSFFAVQLDRMGGSAIPATGLLTDQPIAGLYAAGHASDLLTAEIERMEL